MGELQPLPLEECIALTQQLLGNLIAKPKLTAVLLSKPPVKFLRDIFREVRAVTCFGEGAFSEEELETCHTSREAKLSFLSALLHLVAVAADESALLGTVRVEKVAAGLEPEKTNLLLHKLHFAATDPSCRQRWELAVRKASNPSERVLDKSETAGEGPSPSPPTVTVTNGAPAPEPVMLVNVAQAPTPVADALDYDQIVTSKPQPVIAIMDEASLVREFFPELGQAESEDIAHLSTEVVSFTKQLLEQGKTRGEIIELAASLFPEQPDRKIMECKKLTCEDFDLGRTVGTGAFGRVRLAKFKGNHEQQPFALKILKKAKIVQFDQAPNVKAEKGILQTCDHPFIVHLLNSFQDDRYLYMVMEYVSGGELFSYMRKSVKLPNDHARFYAAEVTLALRYLHEQNIAYRDLKAENLLIDSAGHLKITDFGFAKIIGEDKTWTIQGTPEYLAPEIIQSKGHGMGVDWWALGILTFEMLSGYPPFHDDNPDKAQARSAIYKKIIAGEVDYPSDFDPLACDLIGRLLSVSVEKRCGSPESDMPDPRQHPWYTGLDWEAALRRELNPPWLPVINAPDDTSMFEQYPESSDNANEEDWVSKVDAVEKQNILRCFAEFG